MGELGGLVVQLVVGHELVQLALFAAGVVMVGAEAGVAGGFRTLGAGVGSPWAVTEATAGGGCRGGLGFRVEVQRLVEALCLACILLPQR